MTEVALISGVIAAVSLSAALSLTLLTRLRRSFAGGVAASGLALYGYIAAVSAFTQPDEVLYICHEVAGVSLIALLHLWVSKGGKRIELRSRRLIYFAVGLTALSLLPSVTLMAEHHSLSVLVYLSRALGGLAVLLAIFNEIYRLFLERGGEHLGLVREVVENLHMKEVREGLLAMLLDDVRTPLTGIKGSAQALIQEPQMPEAVRAELLKIIELETDSLAGLFQELAIAMRTELPNTQGLPAEVVLERIRESLNRMREQSGVSL